ncbi:MAG: DUF2156 domain-containing protein [Capsulimonadales bacterium]|nr:DUF2156 domain-containing protein [Capsulimonadales bacterium]
MNSLPSPDRTENRLSDRDVARARDLALRYGWNATAFQVVNPGIRHWFSPDREAVVGYVERQRVRVVAGAPICAEERLPDVLDAFEEQARRAGHSVCYFGAAGRVMSLIGDCPGYSTVLLGAQPVWNPARWSEIIAGHASLRAQVARARNKGVTTEEWPPCRVREHPGLRRVLDEWLSTRPLPPLHFLIEPETLSYPEGRRVFVALKEGTPIGFVNCSPVPARSGWLTEQFVRGHNAPNGTVELLLDTAVRAVAADDARYLTMGLVPLSDRNWDATRINPLWLRLVLTWVRAHGRRFYHFDGLERFKAKFHPETWETIYAVSNEPRFTPRTLYAIAHAFSQRPPAIAVAQGATRALRQEFRRLSAFRCLRVTPTSGIPYNDKTRGKSDPPLDTRSV